MLKSINSQMDSYDAKLQKYKDGVKAIWDPLLERADKLDEIEDDDEKLEEVLDLQKDVMKAS